MCIHNYFCRETHGGKSSEQMFQVLNEKIEKAKEDNPTMSIQFQAYDETHPLLIAIVTPLMQRVHAQVFILSNILLNSYK